MKAFLALLSLWLATAAGALRADELAVTFARSGQKATLPLRGADSRSAGPVALWAFGRRWGEPAPVKNGAVELRAPTVRVPIVFQMAPEKDLSHVLGELVVYPDRPVPWKKRTKLVAVAVPDWFDTWSEAVGLPVRKFKDPKVLDVGSWQVPERPALLILGGKLAGQGLCVTGERRINVLALAADWSDTNENAIRKLILSPKYMSGPLADLQSQNWPLPPLFYRRSLEVVNRQTWIAGPDHPLVEEIRSPQRGVELWRTVFSYLPWPRLLGRSEVADELFLRLLTETAKGAPGRRPLEDRWLLLYPAMKDVKPDERPVLAAALTSAIVNGGRQPHDRAIRAYVLDLRGKISSPAELSERIDALGTIETRIGVSSPLLILGDNAILDHWKWLQLDRRSQRSLRPGVLWWPDNSLPPSRESQLRLMQLFTDWNLSLGNTPREACNEERKHGL
jgi:hypothetical protein